MIYLVQPPLVQLNSPYPAVYYLRSFLEKKGFPCIAADHSIALFEQVFCPSGLEKIFARTREVFGYKTNFEEGAESGGPHYSIARFLSEEERWRSCVGRLTAFLRGQDREWGHLLTLANGVLPSGPRFDTALASFDGQPPADAAPLLAGKLLADLAGFIAAAADSAFALVRYRGSAVTVTDFALAKQDSSGYILRYFYEPWLEDEWDRLEKAMAALPPALPAAESGGSLVIGISIPFPGCLAGALACARSARRRFAGRLTVIAGGGFVNTELRFAGENTGGAEIFDYFDYLSFDKGYGSLEAILETGGGNSRPNGPLYKTMYRDRNSNRVIVGPGITGGPDCPPLSAEDLRREEKEREAARTVFPDYTGTDFSRYCYPVDDVNPMHRLWSDGHWLKAYLAYGCYWHACAFCDVTLDYIRDFVPADPDALFAHLLDQAEKTGVRGIHFVDEAAPASSLLRFAELNRAAGLPLVFWGNIRFEKDYTPDAAAILAAGGLLGVSAGLEVATESGFKRIGKGITLKEVVRSCAAFKEQGILTHAYLIYGYWDEDGQEIIDSAEITRQLFEAGLLDSAFWHQFVLSCHSRLYAE
ncbi:MAG: radical SAM protein, partial [Treponema sp.]|nr:radical SAM protein [Treponema sp.]